MKPLYLNNFNKQKGFYISGFTKNLILTLFLILSIVLVVLFSITLMGKYKEDRAIQTLTGYSDSITQKITSNFKNINSVVHQAIKNNINPSNPISYEELIKRIKADIPNALRVIVSDTPLDEIKPINFPGINYATLDMLKNTYAENKEQFAEIHLFGQKNQYLNYVHILDNNFQTYLIISLPAQELLKDLGQPNIEESKIILTQSAGKFSVVNLRTWGSINSSKKIISNTQTIPNSYFKVQYAYEEPFYLLRNMTTLSALVGLLSSLLLSSAVLMSIYKLIQKLRLEKLEKETYLPSMPVDGPLTIEETIEQHESRTKKKTMKKEFKLDKTIFRAYDIRGIVDEALTVEAVKLIGQSIGTENIKRGKNDIVVARDGRLSGPKLLEALIEGLKKSGCNVINIGAVPTGVLYFATHHLNTGSGVMLTGSHNPPNYNGLKIMLNGETLSGKLIMDLYKSIINEELDKGKGSVQEMDIVDDYVDYISSDIQLENELKVVVDAGNGIGGVIGPQILEEIGCEVIPLHCEVDGNFPNHHPDPSVPDNLKDLIASVKATDADIGIAFDGDADRLGVVTKRGEIIFPDKLLMLFAKDVLTRVPGASIIFDVKCTGHLPKEIVKSGGLPIMWKTGHSFMKAKIKETNAALAGEMSGHFFFNERWFGFDDGIYAAARFLEILDEAERPADEIFDELPNSVSTPELKCHTKEGENYAFMEKFQKQAEFPDANLTKIDGIRADFADGWGIVRCSNTTPCLVLRFDADNEEALTRIKEEFRQQILSVDDSLELPF